MSSGPDTPDRQRWAELKALFIQAVESPPEGWPALVDELRGRDAAQADELQRLLDGHLQTLIQDDRGRHGDLMPGTTLGPYVVTELIGEGGMGQVYRATDARLGRDVAIKVLPPELAADSNRRLRMEREALAMGMISHPNIVTVHDIGDYRGSPYIVSELLEGRTLRQQVKADGGGTLGLTPSAAVAILAAVADALGAAHRRGIVHRDIKPENIFLTSDGRTKVLDFGIAKLTDAPAAGQGTKTGTIIGTLGYMPPEQFRGEAPRPQTDVYACGVVLYELLSGARPYTGRSDADTIGAILFAPLPPLRGVAPALAALVTRSLDRNVEARFADGVALASELRALSTVEATPEAQAHAATPPLDVQPQGPPKPATAATRSARSTAIAVAAVLVSLLIGGLVWNQKPQAPLPPVLPATTPDVVPSSPKSPQKAVVPDRRPTPTTPGETTAPAPRVDRRPDRAVAVHPEPPSTLDTASQPNAPAPAPPPVVAAVSGVWTLDEQMAADFDAIDCRATGALQLRSNEGLLDGTVKLKRDCTDTKRNATDSTEAAAALSTGTVSDDAVSFVTRVVDDGLTTTCRYSGRILGSARGTMAGDVSCEARAVGLSAVLSLRGSWRATRASP